MSIKLDKPYDSDSIEGTSELKLDFSKLGKIPDTCEVIPVAVQNAITNEVILVAYTNKMAFEETIKQRKAFSAYSFY